MPLPFIIGAAAVAAGVGGVASAIHGGAKMKDANDTMHYAQRMQNQAIELFENENKKSTDVMDILGKKELEILSSFEKFSTLIEKIQGRPEFKNLSIGGVDIPDYEAEDIKKVYVGAGVLLGGMGGAAAGTAGGFAAAGATTSAVMALGTASTGTAISTLSGVAATNATLAALGGGSLAAGGGGMALGSTILGGATLGVGLLVGGIIFNVTGLKLSDKADEAYHQAEKTKQEVDKIVSYLTDLSSAAMEYTERLESLDGEYQKRLTVLDHMINFLDKYNWSDFTEREKMMVQNLVLIVGMLNRMCKVNLVIKNEDGEGLNSVNHKDIDETIKDADAIFDNIVGAA